MDEYESLSHTKWECKYHVVVCCERGSLQLERKRCFTEDEGGAPRSRLARAGFKPPQAAGVKSFRGES